ncbi:MAG: hypothetical protein MHM6MM_005257 [Cercozoa sp. M6MM]
MLASVVRLVYISGTASDTERFDRQFLWKKGAHAKTPDMALTPRSFFRSPLEDTLDLNDVDNEDECLNGDALVRMRSPRKVSPKLPQKQTPNSSVYFERQRKGILPSLLLSLVALLVCISTLGVALHLVG